MKGNYASSPEKIWGFSVSKGGFWCIVAVGTFFAGSLKPVSVQYEGPKAAMAPWIKNEGTWPLGLGERRSPSKIGRGTPSPPLSSEFDHCLLITHDES